MLQGKNSINIYEVGLRDGLQIQSKILSTQQKLSLLKGLINAGFKEIQATSFVHPKLVPQLADAEDLINQAPVNENIHLWALVPNEKGAERAANCENLYGISLVMSASDSHNISNVHMKVSESLKHLPAIFDIAKSAGLIIRAELATSFGCPFEGDVPVERIVDIATEIRESGAEYLALADTTGMADPNRVAELIQRLRSALPGFEFSGHFHNTRGAGMANVLAAWQNGISIFDSSFGGLGGCPFAPGASGNVATEDLVHMFHRMGVASETNLDKLIEISKLAQKFFGFELPGQVMKAGPASHLHKLIKD